MPMKLCRCGGLYRKGNYNFHTNSWIHKLCKVLKKTTNRRGIIKIST